MFFFCSSKAKLRESETEFGFCLDLKGKRPFSFEVERGSVDVRPINLLFSCRCRSTLAETMQSAVQKASTLARAGLTAAKPKLRVFAHYAKTELTPPTPGELPQAIAGVSRLIKSAKWSRVKNLTVREAWLNTLVGVEVICWFFVGEVIGRGKRIEFSIWIRSFSMLIRSSDFSNQTISSANALNGPAINPLSFSPPQAN